MKLSGWHAIQRDLLVSMLGECPIMITCSLWALEDIDGSWRIGMLRAAATSFGP